jgi:hypothetical protein
VGVDGMGHYTVLVGATSPSGLAKPVSSASAEASVRSSSSSRMAIGERLTSPLEKGPEKTSAHDEGSWDYPFSPRNK